MGEDELRQNALTDIDRVLAAKPTNGGGGSEAVVEMATLRIACIRRWAPPGSVYAEQAADIDPTAPAASRQDVKTFGLLNALRADYEARQLRTFRAIVEASLFADFLEQAQSLAIEGYLAAAATMGGGVLEERLRSLCDAHAVPLEVPTKESKHRKLKASEMNVELCKASVYGGATRSQVQAWLDVRNDGAHLTDAFKVQTKESISRMLEGVRDFLARVEG
jgi:hypothetical protein